mmetsp:Transcript_2848/g.4830  ORF Transcript_2848/g.4830 Transcript_2848/m.4830 type:complete len:127 (-) Transcript_2848:900-1280(-)
MVQTNAIQKTSLQSVQAIKSPKGSRRWVNIYIPTAITTKEKSSTAVNVASVSRTSSTSVKIGCKQAPKATVELGSLEFATAVNKVFKREFPTELISSAVRKCQDSIQALTRRSMLVTNPPGTQSET